LADDSGKEFDGAVDWSAIGDKAADYTGADLGVLIIKAHKIAVLSGRSVISQEDLLTAVSNIVPTITETRDMVDKAIQFCSDKSYIPASLLEEMNGPVDSEMVPQSRSRRARKEVA